MLTRAVPSKTTLEGSGTAAGAVINDTVKKSVPTGSCRPASLIFTELPVNSILARLRPEMFVDSETPMIGEPGSRFSKSNWFGVALRNRLGVVLLTYVYAILSSPIVIV
jgi:hypothetical protein